MPHIFISYARADSPTAKALTDLLDSEGFDVWWDAELYGGQLYPNVIEKAIDDSRHVIVLWSTASIGSDWVLREARRAHAQGKLLPISIEHISHAALPQEFREVHTIRFEGWAPLLKELQRATGVFGEWASLVVHEIKTPDRHAYRMRPESEAERRAEAIAKGYEREMCDECLNFTLVRNGTSLKCDTCGSTTLES